MKTETMLEKGQGVTEYALILVLIMSASILTLAVIGTDVGNVFSRINFSVGLEESDLPPGTIEVTVIDTDGNPAPDTWVYAFDGAGNWAGRSLRTNSDGIALFEDMNNGSYQFLSYVQPNYFWSKIISFPGQNHATIQMSIQQVTVRVEDSNGNGIPNVYVYAYTANERYWMGVYGRTNNNGDVVLNVPHGDYKFRAYANQLWFWSAAVTVPDQNSTLIVVEEHEVTVTVVDNAGNGVKQSNLYVYAYSESGSYAGVYGRTNGNGRVKLTIPSGNFRFRVYYQAHNYWSDLISSPGDDTAEIRTGERPFTVTVINDAGQPVRNSWVYAFSSNNAYLGLRDRTNNRGEAIFDIPDGNFKFRADYNSTMHWSSVVTTPATLNTTITVR